MIPLAFAPVGKELVIHAVRGNDAFARRLMDIGICKGQATMVVQSTKDGIVLSTSGSRITLNILDETALPFGGVSPITSGFPAAPPNTSSDASSTSVTSNRSPRGTTSSPRMAKPRPRRFPPPSKP